MFKQNIKSCNAKRRRQCQRTVKTTIGLISKKATLHVRHTFFVHFFAVVLHDYNVKLPETSYLHVFGRKCYTYSSSRFFSLPSIFTLHWWPLAFLILSPPLQNFHLFFQRKNVSFVFYLTLDLCCPFSRWVSLACRLLSLFSLFFSCFIFQICRRDN